MEEVRITSIEAGKEGSQRKGFSAECMLFLIYLFVPDFSSHCLLKLKKFT